MNEHTEVKELRFWPSQDVLSSLQVADAKVVGLVLLAYADKFNLPIFFLRLLAYIYARHRAGVATYRNLKMT